jgi:hypothetical protein
MRRDRPNSARCLHRQDAADNGHQLRLLVVMRPRLADKSRFGNETEDGALYRSYLQFFERSLFGQQRRSDTRLQQLRQQQQQFG